MNVVKQNAETIACVHNLYGRADLILTSPPYDNVRETGFDYTVFREVALEAYDTLSDGGTLVWVVSDEHKNLEDSLTSFKQALYFQKIGFKVHTQIYRITNPKPNATRKTNTKDFEYMFICHKGTPKTLNFIEVPSIYAGQKTSGANGRRQAYIPAERRIIKTTKRHSTTWEYTVGQTYSDNATPFPLQLALDVITQYSNPGDLVIDPMVGSGTTAVASIILGRKFFGGDISEKRVNQTIENMMYAKMGYWLGADCPKCGLVKAITRGRNGWSTKCSCPINSIKE